MYLMANVYYGVKATAMIRMRADSRYAIDRTRVKVDWAATAIRISIATKVYGQSSGKLSRNKGGHEVMGEGQDKYDKRRAQQNR